MVFGSQEMVREVGRDENASRKVKLPVRSHHNSRHFESICSGNFNFFRKKAGKFKK